MAVPNAPSVYAYVPPINPTLAGGTFRPVIDEKPLQSPVAINPTGAGARVTPTNNGPNLAAPSAVNPTLTGVNDTGVDNAPLVTLPATTSRLINWTPIAAAPLTSTLQRTPATATAGILTAAGAVVAGSGGPPYVSGNVPVGASQVGTNVILADQ